MTSPHAGSTIAAPPLPNTSRSGSSTGKSSGNAERGMYWGTETTKAPDSDRDVAHRGQPAVGVVGGRRRPDLRRALVDPPARQRHPVLPADQPADASDGGVDRCQVVARADAVEEPLVLGGHELAVAAQQPARAEDEHRVVQRAALALVDPDDAMQVVLVAGRRQAVDERAGDVDRIGVQALP